MSTKKTPKGVFFCYGKVLVASADKKHRNALLIEEMRLAFKR
ncbi:hypothetical protein EDC56_0198 [Sinobacterium caligoides]|uniref:Uncharacterized protein n=1 Tax=Sinobacterium caligoides TaxID=933926 RepID=A0A3N2DZE8_9GAMM|nr:hypothetical protein EDC56_0198 [Sinobacterium caligoides]